MCGVYRIAFIEYILAGKTSLHNTNLFSLNDYKKNDKIIYKYLKVVKDFMFKKMSRLPILAKSKFFVSVNFVVAKLRKIEGSKILTPLILQNVTFLLLI